jgi:palmitoyltransferase
MDHHCPWINGCIGHFNHRYFFLYMTYTVLGCLFIMTFGFEIFFDELFPAIVDTEESQSKDLVLSFFSRRALIVYEAFITTGTFLLLGGLTLWHAMLISKGETSIEAHINKNETKRLKALGQVYKNPFDFSSYHNWCLFLGLIEGRGFSSVLFPSKHKPKGDGLEWDSIYSCDIRWNDDSYYKTVDASKMA